MCSIIPTIMALDRGSVSRGESPMMFFRDEYEENRRREDEKRRKRMKSANAQKAHGSARIGEENVTASVPSVGDTADFSQKNDENCKVNENKEKQMENPVIDRANVATPSPSTDGGGMENVVYPKYEVLDYVTKKPKNGMYFILRLDSESDTEVCAARAALGKYAEVMRDRGRKEFADSVEKYVQESVKVLEERNRREESFPFARQF